MKDCPIPINNCFPANLDYTPPIDNKPEEIIFHGNTHVWRKRLTEIYISPEAMKDFQEWELSDHYAYLMPEITVSKDLGRKELYELGKRGPYHRFVNFPVEVSDTLVPPMVTPSESVISKKHKCNCDITQLMREGCKCGGK